MKPVPDELLELVRKAAPSESEVVPLPWAYEDEDYNIAIVMPDKIDRLEARQLEDRLIDAVIDYDTAHHTFTFCKIWRERDMARPGVR